MENSKKGSIIVYATEEERRLMYVAMTRAKKVLFLMESVYEHCKIFDEGIDECLQTISMPL